MSQLITALLLRFQVCWMTTITELLSLCSCVCAYMPCRSQVMTCNDHAQSCEHWHLSSLAIKLVTQADKPRMTRILHVLICGNRIVTYHDWYVMHMTHAMMPHHVMHVWNGLAAPTPAAGAAHASNMQRKTMPRPGASGLSLIRTCRSSSPCRA